MHKLYLIPLFLLTTAPPHAAAKPLNLLIVTADDMNGDSAGWMGDKHKATPNLDAFAATAYRFVHCHVSAPICQPSREALMTGRVPHRNGGLGFNPIRNDVPTLIETLVAKGYFTAVINKHEHMKPDGKFPWDLKLGQSGKNPKMFGEQVAQALKEAAAKNKPFFLNANITDPHRPFPGTIRPKVKPAQANAAEVKPFDPKEVTVPSFLEDIPDVRKEVAQYYTAVRRCDESFAALMAALKASGQEDKTVILFLNDHGMSFPFSKATVYANGTHAPAILRWPGLKKPAEDRDNMVSSVDLMPTVLELLDVPGPAGMDGRSLLPLVRGEKQTDRDYVITHVNTVSSGLAFPGRCVRTKTRSYIWYAWPDGTTRLRVEAMNDLSFKAMAAGAANNPQIKARVEQYHHGVVEGLYDLEKDKDERVNRINDASYAADRERLKKLLLAHMEKTNDPQLEAFRKRK
jgi:N-sulfoglucosamine sulfohydrolase